MHALINNWAESAAHTTQQHTLCSFRERKNLRQRTFKHELWAVRYFPPALNARGLAFISQFF
jgi:hypothetical protein